MKTLKLVVYEMQYNGLNPIGMISSYISLIYTPSFDDSGSFTLTIPFTKENFNLVIHNDDVERLIWLEDDFIGVCQKIQCKQNQKTKTIKIQGTLAEGLLDNAILRKIVQCTEENVSTNTFLNQIFYADPDDVDYFYRSLYPGIFLNSAASSYKLVPMGFSSGNCSVRRFIKDVCNVCDLGYKVRLYKPTNKLALSVVDYTDHSIHQNENPVVLISSKLGNLYESEFSINSQEYKNFIYALGTYSHNYHGEERKDVPYFAGQGYGNIHYPTGIPSQARRCGIYDIGSLQVPDDVLLAEVAEFFRVEAKKLLYDARLIKSYKCKLVETESPFKFGKDYFLGDKVTIIDDELGLQMDAQLIEYEKTYSQNGESFEPVFGISQPTLNRILKQKGVI